MLSFAIACAVAYSLVSLAVVRVNNLFISYILYKPNQEPVKVTEAWEGAWQGQDLTNQLGPNQQ